MALSDNITQFHTNTGINKTPSTKKREILEWLIRNAVTLSNTNTTELYRQAESELGMGYNVFRTTMYGLRKKRIVYWTGRGRRNGDFLINYHHPYISDEEITNIPNWVKEKYDTTPHISKAPLINKSPKKATQELAAELPSEQSKSDHQMTVQELLDTLAEKGGRITISFSEN